MKNNYYSTSKNISHFYKLLTPLAAATIIPIKIGNTQHKQQQQHIHRQINRPVLVEDDVVDTGTL